MKTQKKIPKSKVQRASKVIGTGMKIGGNYANYYAKKLMGNNDEAELNARNASDIMNTLSQLKGSALKVAQIMSMDSGFLPTAYQKEFEKAQNQAIPLSYPLIKKTFQDDLGLSPKKIFESFNKEATNAASIGQVHEAHYLGQKVAVKIQYPGVAEAISSDLKLIKPLASKLMNIPKGGIDHYLEEVERKLIEEADYELELKQSIEMSNACRHLEGLHFAQYFPEISGSKVLSMSWIEGEDLKSFAQKNTSIELANQLGQYLWDMYVYQIHELKKLHADPHPGNFIVTPQEQLAVLDFGCIKTLPHDFYHAYFSLTQACKQDNPEQIDALMEALDFYQSKDTLQEQQKIKESFLPLMELLLLPFEEAYFDFSDKRYFEQIAAYGLHLAEDPEIKSMNAARGSKHFIYMNRSLFGLFNILHILKCDRIHTRAMLESFS